MSASRTHPDMVRDSLTKPPQLELDPTDPNELIAKKAAEALSGAQRRGELWAFHPGKKSDFGFHYGEASSEDYRLPVQCPACRRMRIANRKVLGRIHRHMMDPDAVYRETSLDGLQDGVLQQDSELGKDVKVENVKGETEGLAGWDKGPGVQHEEAADVGGEVKAERDGSI